MEFDEGGIFYSDQQRGDADQADHESPIAARIKYKEFIRTFRDGESFVYRDALRQAVSLNSPVLEIDLDHVMLWDDGAFVNGDSSSKHPAECCTPCSSPPPACPDFCLSNAVLSLSVPLRSTAPPFICLFSLSAALADDLLQRPAFHLPLFESAALEAAISMAIVDETQQEDLPAFQITLTSSKQPITIRQLLSGQVSRVVMIPGIVIASSKVKAKATMVVAQCKGCHATKQIPVRAGFAGANLPRKCDEPRQPGEAPCPIDPYVIMPDKCKYVDMQTWKLQESPEMVPTGEMPRSIMLSVDRHLVDRAIPGNRVTVTGIMNIMANAGKGGPGGVAIRTPYLQVLGIRHGFDALDAGRVARQLHRGTRRRSSASSRGRTTSLSACACPSRPPSMAPTTSRRPSPACSLVARASSFPTARVFAATSTCCCWATHRWPSRNSSSLWRRRRPSPCTRGKGSSAAGLTATVTQDSQSREFYLEGGAMVLADGGVVCIDEFDKMREQDRVAIHEAMEQQTISVAKAGITTVLNSRTSVLAAANPTFGRYDAEKNAAEQVDFQSTILSRFDMIFILRDEYDLDKDRTLAAHILKVHVQGTSTVREPVEGELDVPLLRRYIAYARKKCSPRLTEAAMETLQNYYVKIRQGLGGGGRRARAARQGAARGAHHRSPARGDHSHLRVGGEDAPLRHRDGRRRADRHPHVHGEYTARGQDGRHRPRGRSAAPSTRRRR